MIGYYDAFIRGVTIELKLDTEAVKGLKEVCEAYGVDWKLDEVKG